MDGCDEYKEQIIREAQFANELRMAALGLLPRAGAGLTMPCSTAEWLDAEVEREVRGREAEK